MEIVRTETAWCSLFQNYSDAQVQFKSYREEDLAHRGDSLPGTEVTLPNSHRSSALACPQSTHPGLANKELGRRVLRHLTCNEFLPVGVFKESLLSIWPRVLDKSNDVMLVIQKNKDGIVFSMGRIVKPEFKAGPDTCTAATCCRDQWSCTE